MAENNENLDDNLDALKSGMRSRKVRHKSRHYFDDMEWFLLVAIMRDPKIMQEIAEIISDPRVFKGSTDDTSHSLIYQALTNLHDDGQEVHFEALYTECEKIRESNPLVKSYSRKAIMELDFQATIRADSDNNRIRAKFCAEQVVRRK